jgi:hypothetical protein
MHKQQALLVSDGSSPGHLADICRELANANINIIAIAGAEWRGRGAVTLITNASTGSFQEATDALRDKQDRGHFGLFNSEELENVAVALDGSQVGALADVLDLLATADPPINIGSLQTFPRNGGTTFVVFGVAAADLTRAQDALDGILVDNEDVEEGLGVDAGDG